MILPDSVLQMAGDKVADIQETERKREAHPKGMALSD